VSLKAEYLRWRGRRKIVNSIRRSLVFWRRAGQSRRGSPIAEGFTLASKPQIQIGNTSNSGANRYKILPTTNGDREVDENNAKINGLKGAKAETDRSFGNYRVKQRSAKVSASIFP
jgi:hypothetical protein